MNRRIYLLTALLVVTWTISAAAGPVAKLLPLNAFGKQSMAAQGRSEADLVNDVPPSEMVKVPAYPGSYFGSSMGKGDELTGLTLASKDSPKKVIDWYRKKLGSGWQYHPEMATAEMGEVGVFIKTDKKKVSDMDALKCMQVRISKVEKPADTGFTGMMFDVTGIKSMINMTLKPMM